MRGLWKKTKKNQREAQKVEGNEALLGIAQPSEAIEEREFGLGDFEVCETLSQGTFGRVRLVKDMKQKKKYYALRIVKKAFILKLELLEALKREIQLFEVVSGHPMLIEFYGRFQDEHRLYCIFEFVPGGELYGLLRHKRRFSEVFALFYLAQIILAFEYLHSLDIVFRSLKPEIILIDAVGNIKIAELSMSKVVTERTFTQCGICDYLAPEIITNLGYGKSVDFWALGVLLFEMLLGYPPFCSATPFGVYENIISGKIPTIPADISISAKPQNLLTLLLENDRTKRLGCGRDGISDLKAHPWFRKMNWNALFHRQVKPPHRPLLSTLSDTRNYDRYPDSVPVVEVPLSGNDHDRFMKHF